MAIEIIEKVEICTGICHHCKVGIRCVPGDVELDYSHINYESASYPAPPSPYVKCPKCDKMVFVKLELVDRIK